MPVRTRLQERVDGGADHRIAARSRAGADAPAVTKRKHARARRRPRRPSSPAGPTQVLRGFQGSVGPPMRSPGDRGRRVAERHHRPHRAARSAGTCPRRPGSAAAPWRGRRRSRRRARARRIAVDPAADARHDEEVEEQRPPAIARRGRRPVSAARARTGPSPRERPCASTPRTSRGPSGRSSSGLSEWPRAGSPPAWSWAHRGARQARAISGSTSPARRPAEIAPTPP